MDEKQFVKNIIWKDFEDFRASVYKNIDCSKQINAAALISIIHGALHQVSDYLKDNKGLFK